MPLMEKLKGLFSRKEIPVEARDLLKDASTPKELLKGLDELIDRNEIEVKDINREMEALENIEQSESSKVRSGELPDRSKNNVLRRIQRLRKQMDNLEERQRIYNRNINLQIHLVGRIQALDAMELRGVDEDRIDEILTDYEDELSRYQSVLDSEELMVSDIGTMVDDSADLAAIEAEILGESAAPTEPAPEEPGPKQKAKPVRAPVKAEQAPEKPAAAKRAETAPADSSPGDDDDNNVRDKPREESPAGKETEL